MSFQTLIFEGNVGRDPEMRFTTSGKPVTSFSVAVGESYKTASGEKVTKTTWYKVTAWDNLAEITNQYLKKGSKVLVEGKLNPDEKTGNPKIWQGKDGNYGCSYEVNAKTVTFLSSANDSSKTTHTEDMPGEGNSGEDMPF